MSFDPGANAGAPAEGDTARVVYILYLVSLIFGVTSIIGLIMAYVYRADAPEWIKLLTDLRPLRILRRPVFAE